MSRNYIAVANGKRNHDPIESGSPRGVWNQLEKATNKTRKELQDMGWRVILDDGVRPEPVIPKPDLAREEVIYRELATHQVIRREPQQHHIGWLILFGGVILAVAAFMIWTL